MNDTQIICAVRKRKITLTPEEEVRQSIIHYLNTKLDYPLGFMSVEAEVKLNGMSKRADIIIHDPSGNALMVIECKRPKIPLDEKTVSQVAMYNHSLQAPYLMLSNGNETHIFHVDSSKKSISALSSIPAYSDL